MSGSYRLLGLHMGQQNLLLSCWNVLEISSGGQDMCGTSRVLHCILSASGISAIFVFRNNIWSRVARDAMTDEILKLKANCNKIGSGVQKIHGVKSLGGIILPPVGTS
jgi:hypothetical protein